MLWISYALMAHKWMGDRENRAQQLAVGLKIEKNKTLFKKNPKLILCFPVLSLLFLSSSLSPPPRFCSPMQYTLVLPQYPCYSTDIFHFNPTQLRQVPPMLLTPTYLAIPNSFLGFVCLLTTTASFLMLQLLPLGGCCVGTVGLVDPKRRQQRH